MKDSKIQWTDHTFNPWIGCTKVSDGCKNCYAEALMDKRWNKVKWGPQGTRVRTSESNWKQPLQWNREAEKEGVRKRVFCASLADVFEDRNELRVWRSDLFDLIEATPNLIWLLLTKRPENVMEMIDGLAIGRRPNYGSAYLESLGDRVWIGTSVENQDALNERLPHLVQIPAEILFLSMEPLLGSVILKPWLEEGWPTQEEMSGPHGADYIRHGAPQIHWVICGGESGHGARPMNPEWARSLRDQCNAAGVPFHFKQWGEYDADGKRVGKHEAGRILDGRTWDELPKTLTTAGTAP